MNTEVKLIHFVNNEDVLGELIEEDATHYVVRNPCALSMVLDENQTPSLSIRPLIVYSKDEIVELNKNHAIYCVGVDNQIATQYNSIFGNIILPEKKIII